MSGIWIRIPHRTPRGDEPADSYCSFCGSERGLHHLISALDTSVCSGCVRRHIHLLRSENIPGWRPWWRLWATAKQSEAASGSGYREMPLGCSFCKLPLADVPALIGDVRVAICSTCVQLCVDVLREAL